MESNNPPKKLILDQFSYRAFDSTKTKNFIKMDKTEFLNKVNEQYKSITQLVDGYAPFCKHIFIKNFVKDLKSEYIEINEETEKLIKTKYNARQKNELPVLIRYIPMDLIDKNKIPDAKFLDLILYSKEQIVTESIAMKMEESHIENLKKTDFDYGIISIKPINIDKELPFTPITMMRNALGVSEGGSGIEIDKKKYMDGVEFWSKNVMIQ